MSTKRTKGVNPNTTKSSFLTRAFRKTSPPEAHPSTVTKTNRNAHIQEQLAQYRKDKNLQHKNAENILKILKKHKKKLQGVGSSAYEFTRITQRTADFNELQKIIRKSHEHFSHEIIDFLHEKKIHPENIGHTNAWNMLEKLVTFYKPGEPEYETYLKKVAELFGEDIKRVKESLLKK